MEEEIPEDHETLEENASQKAWYIYNLSGKDCFADDTGLEVEALKGAPGVYSARYSRMGQLTFPDMEAAEGNIRKLLLELEGETERKARFRTVIALVVEGKEYQFEGVVEGWITETPSGAKGFGYDPVFLSPGIRTYLCRNGSRTEEPDQSSCTCSGGACTKAKKHVICLSILRIY